MLTKSEQAAWDELIGLDAETRALQTSFDMLRDSVKARRNWTLLIFACLAVLLCGLAAFLFTVRLLPDHVWEPVFSIMLVVGFGLAGIAQALFALAACIAQLRTAQRDLQPDLDEARNLIRDYEEHGVGYAPERSGPAFSP